MTGLVTAVGRSAGHTRAHLRQADRRRHQAPGRARRRGGRARGAHAGRTVKHRFRVRQDPTRPNPRQVHPIHAELHDGLRAAGFDVSAGRMGEKATTRGVDLLGLPTGTTLRLGEEASVRVTGLRNPCGQLNGFRPGLMEAVLDRDEGGNLVRKAGIVGIMGIVGIVVAGGEVRPGDAVRVGPPPGPRRPLERV